MHPAEPVLTAAQMRAEEAALVEQGISVDTLMQRAGRGAADWVWRVAMGRSVTVLCGPGNNGGDGYVIAETLRERGLAVMVIAAHEPATDAARTARRAWAGEIVDGSRRGGVLVDCLFGSGLSRPLSGADSGLLTELVRAHEFTVAVDLPSGVATDDGALLGEVPSFNLTLALGAWKPAHFLMPATACMGELRLVDIGVGASADSAFVFPRPHLASPPFDAHKYSRGLVGVVAGAMPGAALLAAQAAMRGGAGYVKLLSPHSHPAAPAGLVIDDAPLADALADKRWSALLVGPGLGRDEESRSRLAVVLERGVPTVLDADALHLLDDDLLEGVDTSRLLVTPHEGELRALCESFAIDGPSKFCRARALAERIGLTILAKGPDTFLVDATGQTAFFTHASSWLSTAGTGDVLAGVAASRMASCGDAFAAAGEAVSVHLEAARISGPAFTSDDLSFAISSAYRRFL